ncbi:MAG: diacylglycerol kinase family protein [Ilumatobacteraceae bacterium]
MSRRYHVFVNSDAGSVGEADQSMGEIADAFRRVGVEVEVAAVDAHDLPAAMRGAWRPGVEAIIIAGGDGTINCAAGAAVGSDIVLGVLPMGTFNHFAKDLGVPDDLPGAVKFLAEAEVADIDIGEVNGRVFVNNASIGVYPTMVADREAIRRQRGWGKIRAAPVAIVHTLRRLPVHHMRLTIDESGPETVATPFLFVGNGLFDQHGERLGTRTSLDDHRLGVYVIATTGRWRLVANAIRARFGGIDAAGQTRRRAAESLAVDCDESTLKIALDGEPTDLRAPLKFRSRAGALRVLATPTQVPNSD